MNYQRIYDQIIDRAKNSERKKNNGVYYELHHIVPVCKPFLGDNSKQNKVLLTAREHFICHRLLTFIYNNHSGLFKAYYLMAKASSGNQERNYHISSREFERMRIQFSMNQTGEKNHMYKNGGCLRNRKISQETKDKRRATMLKAENIVCEWCGKISNNKGLMTISHGDRCRLNPNFEPIKIICEWCGKEGIESGGMRANHFENCKKNPNYKPKEKQLITCPHCGKTSINNNIFKKYHFEFCKLNPNRISLEKELFECPHCGKIGTNKGAMSVAHFDNCPKNPDYVLEDHIKICNYCGFVCKNPIHIMYHFNNCRQKPDYKYIPNIVECPHCGKKGDMKGMTRYHFDNCKFKK